MSRACLLAATFAAYLPAAALPAIAEGGGLPGGSVDPGLLVVPFCLGFAVAFQPWGRMADRHSPAGVVRIALLGAALAGVLVALAPTAWALVVARLLEGALAAGVPPAVQAALAAAAPDAGAGRAVSGMMIAVALATLGGPAVAPLLADAAGWTGAVLLLAVVPALAVVLASRDAGRLVAGARATASARAAYDHPGGVRAGWLVSALVLGGHWTVLTRLTEALDAQAAGLAALTGAAGLPLVVIAARLSDREGPRITMTWILALGAGGFALASRSGSTAAFIALAGVGLAVYWAYLPVVAAQVQRSAGAAARGRAAGGLYASMWGSAALAGALATLAPSWREVVLGAGLAWGLAAVVAARSFLGRPAGSTESRRWPHRAPQPSPR